MKSSRNIIILLALAIIILFALNIFCGSVKIPAEKVLSIITGAEDDGIKRTWRFIILESRLPQALTALLSGGALAVSGLMLQTAFRNPLADPGIFGISSGASLGVALIVLLFGGSIAAGTISLSGFTAIFVGAFLGAMAVMSILFIFSRYVRSNVMLLIVGIMIGYLSSSVITLLNFFATEEGVKSYLVWGMGDFSGVTLSMMPLYAAIIIACLVVSIALIKPLNILLLGQQYAENLGINTQRIRNILLLVTGLLTAIVTAFCGPVSFLGLAVPHLARLLLRRSDHKVLLPTTIMMGSAIALLCNIVCVMPSTVIPLNAVTPLIGAPVIIYIVIKNK